MMHSIISVCEWIDHRGFGLAHAALHFARAIEPQFQNTWVVNHPPSGDETTYDRIAFEPNGVFGSLLKTPRALFPTTLRLKPNIVHLHGIWTGAVSLIPQLKKLGAKVVVSPHGMCEPYILARGRWKKALLNLLFHKRCMAQADAIHALNEHEAQCVRDYLGPRCPPIHIIPNGVDGPSACPQRTGNGPRDFLFCGRFDPKKNIDGLLTAWVNSGVAANGHRLLLGGDGSDAYAQSIKERAQQTAGVKLLGAIHGETKHQTFTNCHFGILSSHSEGLPMAVLESLAYGMPCITTTGCRMPMVADGMGWVLEPAEVSRALQEAAALPEPTYTSMSQRAFTYAKAEHHWPTIGARLGELYESLV